MSILTLEDVSYTYEGMRQEVLRGINADFELGRVYAIQGKSGAGKSTLLSLLAGLDLCSRGRILFDGTDMRTLDRDIYRARDIGVVFQSFNLINNARAVENIVLSMCISRSAVPDKRAYALELLDRMGIDRETAAEFTFLLSTPIILGDAGYHFLKLHTDAAASADLDAVGGTAAMIVGIIAAAVVGILVIRLLLNFLKKRSLAVFSVYRFVLGAAVIIAALCGAIQ